MKLLAPLALAALLTASASAQSTFTDPANLRGERVAPLTGRELPIDKSEALGGRGLEQLLRKLNTRASLMLIVAHPDDEDGGMLTYYSRGLGARVADLSLNRGEGGQNLMTGDFEDALGLLRTQELLAADRYFDADQFFGTEVDFGFSKTKEESFAKWTHERVLYDAVRAVRLYRPLVIASVWIGNVTDGHGQHQVSGQIAQEVFKAAGDPNVFPELTREGILPWQPLKVYARVPMQAITPQGLFDYATGRYTPAKFTNYVTGEVTTTTPSVDVTVHEGKIDPILGPHRAVEDFVSYVQFARQGLGLQKSQIGANVRIPPPGVFDVSYHRYGSMLPASRQKLQEDSFFDGIDTSLAGIASFAPTAFPELQASLAKIQADINVATDHLDPTNVAKVAPTLADALKQCDSLVASVRSSTLPAENKQNVLHELLIKRTQLNDALVLALGFTMEAELGDPDRPVVVGETTTIHARIDHAGHDSSTQSISKMRFIPTGPMLPVDGLMPVTISTATGWSTSFSAKSSPESNVSRPYFFRSNIERPVYDLFNKNLRLAPATPPAITILAAFEYEGVEIRMLHTVNMRHRYPNGETISEPAEIVPPVSVSLAARANVVPRSASSFTGLVEVRNTTDHFISGSLNLGSPMGWSVSTSKIPLMLAASGEPFEATVEMHLLPPSTAYTGPLNNGLSASVTTEAQKHYDEGFRAIGYPGIPSTNYFTRATDRIVSVDLKLPAQHNIAYLPGTGDAVPETLTSIGLKPTTLTIADLTAAKLAQYDTVILGVRTYAAHPDLHGAPTQALLDYARNGGNVIVQYQTGEFTEADAPYPLAVGNAAERVIDETDPVQLLAPDSPLLTTPNKITPADFDNWIEERGHGFLRTWDSHYTALTETHDPGDPPQRGGLVTVQLGKGRWTYCAYALYRQLPEAVPGAFRLFINLINP